MCPSGTDKQIQFMKEVLKWKDNVQLTENKFKSRKTGDIQF